MILYTGGSASVHAGIHHPPEQSILGDTVNERAVRILLECNLVEECGYFSPRKLARKRNYSVVPSAVVSIDVFKFAQLILLSVK